MKETENRKQLADFLRARRSQLAPADIGLLSTGRRRTPGLRREEVSQMSGVSLTWYTWLEQGRDINVSRQVLNAIARTLLLDPAEAEHMAALAGIGVDATRTPDAVAQAPESLQRLLRAITPNPAYAITPHWDVVAWNEAYAALFTDITTIAPERRNLLWMVFTNMSVRHLLVDWEIEARRLMAQFRAEAGHLIAHEPYQGLLLRLNEASTEFRQWWPHHDVAHFASRRREFDHPVAGRLAFDHHKLTLADHPGLRIVVYTPTGS
ncbi:helix-turn-helix transcriptional regulator [soil metagenome]